MKQTATVEEINAAYKALRREVHPDKNLDNPADETARFQAVRQAFEFLSDPDKRKALDAQITACERTSRGNAEGPKCQQRNRTTRGTSTDTPYARSTPMFNLWHSTTRPGRPPREPPSAPSDRQSETDSLLPPRTSNGGQTPEEHLFTARRARACPTPRWIMISSFIILTIHPIIVSSMPGVRSNKLASFERGKTYQDLQEQLRTSEAKRIGLDTRVRDLVTNNVALEKEVKALKRELKEEIIVDSVELASRLGPGAPVSSEICSGSTESWSFGYVSPDPFHPRAAIDVAAF